jgi:hypothetical protein
VTLQTDGQVRTGRDVVIAAMLGAEAGNRGPSRSQVIFGGSKHLKFTFIQQEDLTFVTWSALVSYQRPWMTLVSSLITLPLTILKQSQRGDRNDNGSTDHLGMHHDEKLGISWKKIYFDYNCATELKFLEVLCRFSLPAQESAT